MNVSLADAAQGDMATKCGEIGAQPLVTNTKSEFFQIRVSNCRDGHVNFYTIYITKAITKIHKVSFI